MKSLNNIFLKTFVLNVLIVLAVMFCAGCLNNDNKDLDTKLNNAEVLVLDGFEYKSNTVQAEANKTYYFKVTNELSGYSLNSIKAYDVDNLNSSFTSEKAFGIEGSNAFWTVKVYNENKQKLDFIGSLDNFLYDPMAEKFELNFGKTCYFAVTFTQSVNFVFSFGAEEI